MANTKNNNIMAGAYKRVKIETTYEYIPIVGEVLGYWKKQFEHRVGDGNFLYIKTDLSKFDSLFINDKEIDIESITKEKTKAEKIKELSDLI